MPSSLISNISTASSMVQQKNSMNNKKYLVWKTKPLSLWSFMKCQQNQKEVNNFKFIAILPKKKFITYHGGNVKSKGLILISLNRMQNISVQVD